MSALLEVEGVSKSFGGNHVLSDVSFSLADGTLALVGPNGAGKTTLLNIVAGQLSPDRGAVRFRGARIDRLPPSRIVHRGLVKTYQVVRPLRSFTVAQHIELFSRVRGSVDAERILALTGLGPVRDRRAGELSFGDLKRLELAKALAVNPELLLLDEPIGGLSRDEARRILGSLEELKRDGMRMIVVEHRLLETLSFVDQVVALDQGRTIFSGSPARFFADPAVRAAYLGGGHAPRG